MGRVDPFAAALRAAGASDEEVYYYEQTWDPHTGQRRTEAQMVDIMAGYRRERVEDMSSKILPTVMASLLSMLVVLAGWGLHKAEDTADKQHGAATKIGIIGKAAERNAEDIAKLNEKVDKILVLLTNGKSAMDTNAPPGSPVAFEREHWFRTR